MVDVDGGLWSMNTAAPDEVEWYAETGDITDSDPYKSGLSKLWVRLEVDETANVTVKTQYDDDGTWHVCRSVVGDGRKRSVSIPVIPRRCDHFRIRIDGKGGCRIFGISREYYQGSDI